MDHVAADGVPPAHVPPLFAKWVVLEKQMVLALVIDKPVGVVHPVLKGRKVKLRAEGLIVRATGSVAWCTPAAQ